MNSRIEQMEAEADAMIQQMGNTEQSTTTDAEPSQSETPDKPTSLDPQQMPKPSQDNTWEHRYRILQGKYNKEIGELNNRVKQLESDNQTLRQKAEVQTQSNESSEGDLSSEFGDDFDRAVESKARRIADERVKALEQKFEKHFQQQPVQQPSGQDAKIAEIANLLSQKGVNFQQTDSDPLFHDYLRQTDQRSGLTLHQLLSHNFNSGNIQQAAQFYLDYAQQAQPNTKSNPLEESIDAHRQSEMPDSMTNNTYTPEQIGQLIADNEDALVQGKITQVEYEKRDRELFGLLNRR
ncbi:hypothetical protein [Gayadomonas joobiniege]|uniref:hypothetical protein n=1 Tax=Gayadomonas joobiniege TaxID=1234606 RepID=UPI00036725A8|nr:hypothetical protein [Gayadomonas joobiniege]